MKTIKPILLSVLILVILTIVFFVFSLFINKSGEKIIIALTIIVFFILFVYGLICAITGKSKIVFINGRFRAFIFLFVLVILGTNIVAINVINMIATEYYGKDISKRIEVYLRIGKKIINDNKQAKVFNDKKNKEKFGNITYYYDNTIYPKESFEIINNVLPKVKKAADHLFEKTSEQNINVIFCDNERELESISSMKDIDGYYDSQGRIYLLAYKQEDEKLLYVKTFMHEYTHYRLEEYIRENNISHPIPQWFNEGIAEYISYDGRKVDTSLDKIQDFSKMNTFEGFNSSAKQYVPYLQSYSAINELIKMKGSGIIRSILLNCKNDDFYNAFKSAVGISFDAFQDKYFKK